MKWEPFQKNWAATMDYAKTKSSVRVYPGPTKTMFFERGGTKIISAEPGTAVFYV